MERRRALGSFVGATALLLLLLAIHPVSAERLLTGYVLVLAALALASLTRVVQPASTRVASAFEQALRDRAERPTRPPELVRTERELTLAAATAGHAHRRLLPLLREVAAARLWAGHGIELWRRPERARAILGEETWELVDPDRPEPDDRNAPGIPLPRVASVVDRLEEL
ncbi:MAG TPA: hypothetical protein VFJ77_01555 [Gaiellaceae bacterium]|nr:hypothetical protein [Gaiellaceae bacterium]